MANRPLGTAAAVALVAGIAALGVARVEVAGTPAAASEPAERLITKDQQVIAGRAVYSTTCTACHHDDGNGVPGTIPRLFGPEFVAKGPDYAISVVLHGLKGQLPVHGKGGDPAMPQMFQLSNEEVANVLTFVYSSWGNPGWQVHSQDVAEQRYDRALAPQQE